MVIVQLTTHEFPKMRKVFEDTKGVIKSRKYKDRHYNGQKKRTTGQTMIYKTLHRKLKIEQHESH